MWSDEFTALHALDSIARRKNLLEEVASLNMNSLNVERERMKKMATLNIVLKRLQQDVQRRGDYQRCLVWELRRRAQQQRTLPDGWRHWKIPSGVTEIPFELPLRAKPNKTLYETYHGVFVNVQYTIVVEMKRSFLSKDLQKEVEFILEYSEWSNTDEPNPVDFSITPQSLANVKDCRTVPSYSFEAILIQASAASPSPFATGTVVVERANVPICSIDIELDRCTPLYLLWKLCWQPGCVHCRPSYHSTLLLHMVHLDRSRCSWVVLQEQHNLVQLSNLLYCISWDAVTAMLYSSH